MTPKTRREVWDKVAALIAFSWPYEKQEDLRDWADAQGFLSSGEYNEMTGKYGKEALRFIKGYVDDETLQLWCEDLKLTKEQRKQAEKESPGILRRAEKKLMKAIKEEKEPCQ